MIEPKIFCNRMGQFLIYLVKFRMKVMIKDTLNMLDTNLFITNQNLEVVKIFKQSRLPKNIKLL